MFLDGDDFGGYGSNANVAAAWGTGWILSGTDPWGGPQARNGGSNTIKQTAGFVAGDTFIYAFRLMMTNWSAAASRLFSIYDINGVEHIRFRVTGAKQIEVTRAGTVITPGSGNTIGSYVLQNNVPVFFSLKGKINDTTGFVEMKVDGVTDISILNSDTKNAGTSDIPSGLSFDGVSDMYLSSFYVANAQGTNNNDHPPVMRAERVIPNANGDLSGYAALGGGLLSAELDDGALHDGSASVVTAAAPASFLVNMGALSNSPLSIVAVYGEAVHMKSDAGACTARIDCKVGANTTNGATLAPAGGTFGTNKLPMGVNPAGAAWAVADVNGMQLGMTRLT